MKPPRHIETNRLLLRPTELGDAAAVLDYQSDPDVTRHLTFPPASDIEEAKAFLDRCARAWREATSFPLAITNKEDDMLLGVIEPQLTGHGIEVGYVLRRSEWNNGYMTEALEAVTSWAFEQPGVFRVWAYVDMDNIASQRVLEKAGFTSEGVLHRWANHVNMSPQPRDAVMYARWR